MSPRLPGLVLAASLAGTGSVQAQDACAAPPEPVLGLSYDSRYAPDDDTRSELDPKAEADAEAALQPVDDFLRALAKTSDTMLESAGTTRQAHADCLIRQIAVWAEANALSDQRTETARLGLGSRLASFALLTRQAEPYTTQRPALRAIGQWLARRMEDQMRFWEIAPDGASRGNLRAWAGLAGAATAGLTNDPVIRGWSVWSTAYVLCAVRDDGGLPQEMTRGRLALHYQLHALAPLVSAVVLLEQQGIPMRAQCSGALQRAVHFALNDLTGGGAQSTAITGEPQSFFDGSATLKDFHIAWIEAYLSLTRDPLAETFAAPRRPLNYSKLGGDQTLIWRNARR